jgi:hypothetical protein
LVPHIRIFKYPTSSSPSRLSQLLPLTTSPPLVMPHPATSGAHGVSVVLAATPSLVDTSISTLDESWLRPPLPIRRRRRWPHTRRAPTLCRPCLHLHMLAALPTPVFLRPPVLQVGRGHVPVPTSPTSPSRGARALFAQLPSTHTRCQPRPRSPPTSSEFAAFPAPAQQR